MSSFVRLTCCGEHMDEEAEAFYFGLDHLFRQRLALEGIPYVASQTMTGYPELYVPKDALAQREQLLLGIQTDEERDRVVALGRQQRGCGRHALWW